MPALAKSSSPLWTFQSFSNHRHRKPGAIRVCCPTLPLGKKRKELWRASVSPCATRIGQASARLRGSSPRIRVVTPPLVRMRAEQLRGETGIGKVREFAEAKEVRRRSDQRYGLCQEMDKQREILRQREEVSAPCCDRGC
jgi:hypothetical protein